MIYVDHCPNVIMLDRDEFKKQFGQVVNEIFKKYDQEKKGYLNESEFSKLSRSTFLNFILFHSNYFDSTFKL